MGAIVIKLSSLTLEAEDICYFPISGSKQQILRMRRFCSCSCVIRSGDGEQLIERWQWAWHSWEPNTHIKGTGVDSKIILPWKKEEETRGRSYNRDNNSNLSGFTLCSCLKGVLYQGTETKVPLHGQNHGEEGHVGRPALMLGSVRLLPQAAGAAGWEEEHHLGLSPQASFSQFSYEFPVTGREQIFREQIIMVDLSRLPLPAIYLLFKLFTYIYSKSNRVTIQNY